MKTSRKKTPRSPEATSNDYTYQSSTNNWHHRTGRRLSGRIPARKGYIVHGVKRRTSLFNTDRIDHLYRDPHEQGVRFFLHHGDLTDSTCLIRIIQQTRPDEIYNLAAQSHVAVSFEEPEYTANFDALGALRILEAIRILGLEKKARFYQASTSELYGLVQEIPLAFPQISRQIMMSKLSWRNANGTDEIRPRVQRRGSQASHR